MIGANVLDPEAISAVESGMRCGLLSTARDMSVQGMTIQYTTRILAYDPFANVWTRKTDSAA
jgi:hypothetical protein